MASLAYDGKGVGGKLRRRFFRRSDTPYDRPPSASRGGVLPPEPQQNGWLSRLVDPASRIIYGGASRLLSSVFGKQQNALLLPPPPPPTTTTTIPDENPLLNQEISQAVCLNSLGEAQEEGAKGGDSLLSNSDNKSTFELEELLKQRTFTRAEFNYLRDLIESRTIGSDQEKPAGTNKEASCAEDEKINDSTGFHGKFSTPNQSLPIPEEEVASPAEIAKAYMGSRPSKLSPSSLNLRRHVFREETASLASSTPYAARSSDVSVWPRSVVRFPKIREQPGNGYFTPRPPGRSAIYKMSRSPYFKVPTKAEVKGDMLGGDKYAGPSTSSHWAATNSILASKQILKRGNSVLESDHGSFGPIRRIRQKSNLMHPLKNICTPSRNLLPSSSTPIGVDNLSGFTSIQRPLQFNAQKYGLGSEDARPSENRILGENGPHIPAQSFETAQKILQKLDKLVSSPKERSSELKANDGSPSKLTLGMPQGQALRSIEGIDSSNFMNSSRNFTVDDTHDSLPQSIPLKQDIPKNGPLEPGFSQVKLTPESAVNVHAITPSTNAKSDSEKASGSAISGFAAVPLQEQTTFKVSAVEGSLEMDDDYNILSGRDKESKAGFKDTISNTEISDEPFLSTSQSMSASTTKPFGLFESKTSDAPVGFSFTVTPCSSSFNTKAAQPATIFLSKSSDTMGLKSSRELSTSHTLTATQLEDSDLFRDKIRKAGQLLQFNTFGSPVPPDISGSAGSSIFALGAPANSSLNNGSLNPKPSANFGSNASGSGNPMVSIFSTGNAANTSPTSSLVSSTVPMFSTVNTFPMVASDTTCAPASVSATFDASGSKDLEAKSTKSLPFSFTSASSLGTSAISNPGIKDSSLSTGSSTLGTSSSLVVPATFATSVSSSALTNNFNSTASASFTSALPSTFSSTFRSHSTSSSVFSSTGSGIFGFSFPVKSSGPSESFASNSSQSSNPASSAFGAQANSSSAPSLTSSPSLGFGSSLSAQSATGLSSSSSQSAPSIFGSPAAGNLQLSFGSSSGPAFSFTASTSTPMPATFGSGFPLNNQMNTDNMADDPLQSTAPTFPSFGQPSFPVSSPAMPPLGIQQPIFQFGQPATNADPGGSFSLGTTGDDKAHRRFVRVKRGKTGKK